MDFDSSLENLVQKWLGRLDHVEPAVLRMPLSQYLEEAQELSALMDRHLDPLNENGVDYPGLSRAFDEVTLTWETASEMRELVSVILALQARASSDRSAPGQPPSLDEMRRVRAEWMSGLRYLFQQKKDESGLRVLRNLRREFKQQSRAAITQSLWDVLSVASDHIDELARFGLAHEQMDHARRLPEQVQREFGRFADARRAASSALSTRNQLIRLLDDRVNSARRAFRFVFRGYDDVLDKAQSDYARTRRKKHAKKRAAEEKSTKKKKSQRKSEP